MSARVAVGRTSVRTGQTSRRQDFKAAGLQLVRPVRQQARRAPFVVVVLTVLGLGLIGLISLSIAMQAQTFQISELSRESASLHIQEQALEREVQRLQSPANLAAIAMGQGMVPGTSPVFLRLSDGVVIGTPTPAEPGTNIGGGS